MKCSSTPLLPARFPPGERIVETDYAERLHISRTPLREALRKLERDGLVEICAAPRRCRARVHHGGRGRNLHHLRNALEMLTLPAIIEKATPADIASLRARLHEMDKVLESGDIENLSPMARAFHSEITRISGLNRILRVIESQDEFINRFSAMAIRQENRRVQAHGNTTSWWNTSKTRTWSIWKS